MINSVQASSGLRPLRAPRRGVRASLLLLLFGLGGLLVWAPGQAGAQVFAINPINNLNVLVGTPITIQVSVTNTTGASSQLTWSLNSNPATTANLDPLITGPFDPTTFNWTPAQAQVV